MNLIYGLIKSEKLENEARRTNAEAAEMIETSCKRVSKQKEKAQSAMKLLMIRKQGTVQNLKNFEDILQRIIDLGAVIDDGSLDALDAISVNALQEYHQMPKMDVSCMSDKQILTTFLFHGIGGLMIKDAEVDLDVASAKRRTARVLESSNNATVDIYEEIEKLATMQKNLISTMNSFFNKSVRTVTRLLDEKGNDMRNYSQRQLQQILVCCKCARILNAMVKTEVMGQDYKMTEQAQKVFGITEKFIKEIGDMQGR
jgi:hypothetical protein